MPNYDDVTAYKAEVAISKYHLVKPGSTEGTATIASSATDALLGVTTDIDANAGETVDVAYSDIGLVQAGGTIAAGDPLTSDANGAAVKAAPAAGANNRIVGFAKNAGVAGDIINVFISPGQIQG